jgi:hypothetical protein
LPISGFCATSSTSRKKDKFQDDVVRRAPTLMLKSIVLFPNSRPDSEPALLWRLQGDLLLLAESKFGPRDNSKKVFQPIFVPDGPHLINTPTLDGAFVALSPSAAGYWPTAVYEMAHETVHLLNSDGGIHELA